MKTYSVSFFGHREIDQPFLVEERLERIIKWIVCEKEFTEFLIGRDGEFDILAASVVKRVTKECGFKNTALVLVLPYMKAEYRENQKNYLNYYDEVEICNESSTAYFKAAIQIRNRSMVDRSDLVIGYVERKSGGAYKTLQYAEKKQKKVMNLCESQDFEFFL